MPTIKTMNPAGGGDFTTWQTWENYADDEASADQWVEGYTGNGGSLVLTGWTSTPTSSVRPRVYSHLSHDGTLAGALNVAQINSVAAGLNAGLYCDLAWLNIDGLFVRNQLSSAGGTGISTQSGTISSTVVAIRTTNTGSATYRGYLQGGPSSNIIFENCVALWLDESQNAGKTFIGFNHTGGNPKFLNCLSYDAVGNGSSSGFLPNINGHRIFNCAAWSPGTAYASTGTPNANRSYGTNVSGDSTAPGTVNWRNVDVADFLISVDASSWNLNLKAGADGINAGTDLSADFTDDMTGATRTQWDVGPLAYVPVQAGCEMMLGVVI